MAVADGAGVPERVVIVGAGLAGSGTATALRQLGYAGELVLVGAEIYPPYDRPPLSKAVLLADGEPPDPALPFDADALGVDLRLGVRAVGWRPGAVLTKPANPADLADSPEPADPADPAEIACPAMVVATGSTPIRLPGTGAHYLRGREDAYALRAKLHDGMRVVIVGAGWIGAEVATAARRRGCAVTVLEQAETPVAHALPASIGAVLARWYAEAGVRLRCGTTVAAVQSDCVELADGERVDADVVVVGVGVRPACDWLADTPIALDRGVLVGADLRVENPADAPVWAVGDVAARWSPRSGRRVRGEHWDDALRAPAVAAASILGRPDQTYDPVPYVWSEQFGRMVQYAGEPGAGIETVYRGDPAHDDSWAVLWLDADGVVVGALGVDRPRDFVQARRLAETGTAVDPDRLADPAVAVKAARVA